MELTVKFPSVTGLLCNYPATMIMTR